MPQTAANFRSEDDAIDHTPAAAVLGGDVVVVGQIPLVALTDIAANTLGSLATEGIFAVPKITGAIALGDQIFWNPTGSPVSGDAASGACNNTGVGRFMGYAVAAGCPGPVFPRAVFDDHVLHSGSPWEATDRRLSVAV